MLDEQCNQLCAIHQSNGHGIRALGLISGTRAEVTRGDDQSLTVCAEAPAHLLNDWCLDVPPPALA
jgi:hypothetical protein